MSLDESELSLKDGSDESCFLSLRLFLFLSRLFSLMTSLTMISSMKSLTMMVIGRCYLVRAHFHFLKIPLVFSVDYFHLVGSLEYFHLVESLKYFHLVESLEYFHLVKSMEYFDLVESIEYFDLVESMKYFELVESFEYFSSQNIF